MFKGLANLASLVKQAQQMGAKLQGMTDELKSKRVTGSAGAGMVEVEANGVGEILNVRIDAALIERRDKEMIEDLLPAAVNQALAKSRELHAEAMQAMTSDMNVPGLDKAIQEMSNQPPGP